jgi:subtilisin family serine protease
VGTVSASTPVSLKSISITSEIASKAAGFTKQLKAIGYFSDGNTKDLTSQAAWSSGDITVLTINSEGLASLVRKGDSKISVSFQRDNVNTIVASIKETVLEPTAINIVISYVISGITSIQNLATATMQAVVTLSDNTTKVVTAAANWTVSTLTDSGNATIALSQEANTATLTGSAPGSISLSATYSGLTSNSLSLAIEALPPSIQNMAVSVNVLGTSISTVIQTITATDPQGLPLTYNISKNGVVGVATIDAITGILNYSIAGHTTEILDTVIVAVTNTKKTSTSTVIFNLKNDPLLVNQWHLQNIGKTAFSSTLPTSGNDMNVAAAWAAGYTGKGIKVAIVDTGLEIAHEDLSANVDKENSRNFLDATKNPTSIVTGSDHGTQVAGIIGAVAFNGKGGRGVAYESTLRGYNYLASGAGTVVNLGNALGLATYSADNDIFNESFGNSPTNLDAVTLVYDAMNSNALLLRDGKGAILIQSAGNEFTSFGDGTLACLIANTYGMGCGHPATDTRRAGTLPIIVGAINADGIKSSYSTVGSPIWVSAPGGEYGYDSQYKSGLSTDTYKPAIVTTAMTGCTNAKNKTTKVNALDAQGLNASAVSCQYTALMNGTSSAAPNLSGVVALMLQANTKLNYRDVKHILAKTAKRIDPTFSGVSSTTFLSNNTVIFDQGWVKNAADYYFSNWYGFGAVDASAAVNMAKDYKDFMPIQQSSSLSKYYTSNVTVPNASKTGTTMSFAMAPSFTKVEQVILTININASPALTCNQIELSSPSGTKSIVMHAANGFSNSGVLQTSLPGTRFLSNAFYGETPLGTWTLRFLDFCNSLTRTTILTSNTQKLNITGN